jgi:hypothetical protein
MWIATPVCTARRLSLSYCGLRSTRGVATRGHRFLRLVMVSNSFTKADSIARRSRTYGRRMAFSFEPFFPRVSPPDLPADLPRCQIDQLQSSDGALPTTARRAKRENGGLGEDPPGSPRPAQTPNRSTPEQ